MYDIWIKRIFELLKVIGVAAPIALSVGAYIKSDLIFKNIAKNLAPVVTSYIDEVVPKTVFESLQKVEIKTRLDSTQMNQLEVMMMEYQEATLKAIPGEVAKQGKLIETRVLTRRYEIRNVKGEHIQNLVGVKQPDGEWFIYIENIKDK